MESVEYFSKEGQFRDKNIIVTGSTGGIGSIVVESLVKCGANVIAVARNEKKVIEKFGRFLNNKNIQFGYELINLEDPAGITRGFKSMITKFKGRVDSLLLCHGNFKVGTIVETGVDVFDSALNVNVRSNFHMISLASPFLKLSKGNVVAVSSVESKIPVKDGFLNSVSKAMLNSLIECSALELSSFGVRINGVAPGGTSTSQRVTENFKDGDNLEYLKRMGVYNMLNKTVL